MAKGTTLKRFILGLFAAITALLFARKKAAAPGKDGEFKLAPVPDARASGPEDATPLTEEEQAMMAERAPEFKGFSAPPRTGVPIDKTPGPDAATPLTEDEQATLAQRLGGSGSANVPPPISYEISKQNAEEAEALRKAGDSEGADALEQRVYFTAPEPAGSDAPPPISHEIAQQNADEAGKLRDAGDTDAADALDQRIYAAAPADDSGDVPPPISQELAQENADNAAARREAGDSEGAEQLEQRMYFAAPDAPSDETPLPVSYALADSGEEAYAEVPGETASDDASGDADRTEASAEQRHDNEGDTTPEPTSESFDIITDGADHTGQEAAEIEDPTEVGLDIDVDLDDEDDEEASPELTSEAFDGGEAALGIAAGNQETAGDGFILVPDEQDWCPDDFPIKGNASSRIYHKPGESSYDATNPEICFASDEAAAAKGFRPRKR